MPKAAVHSTPSPVTPFHNLSAADIADTLGRVKAEAAEVKEREDALKAELVARGVTEAQGDLFRATITEAARWSLDANAIRAEMGETWCDRRSKVATVITLRVSARTGARRAA